MTKLKSFYEFELNENNQPSSSPITKSMKKGLVGLLTGDPSMLKDLIRDIGGTGALDGAGGTDAGGSKIGISTGNEDDDLETIEVPDRLQNIGLPTTPSVTNPPTSGVGSDDFMLYMQHQQGVAGATGIIRASLGTGSMHPATIKNRGSKYTYLTGNVPADRPNVKQGIIRALDAGDQKTAAKLFLDMWREKWHSLGQKAISEINSNHKIKEIIAKYARQYDVPFDFAVKVAYIESRFNPDSGGPTKTNPKGRRYKGLYALSKEGFEKYSKGGNIFNPDQNAKAGIATLRENIRDFIKTMGPTVGSVDISPWAKQLA